MRCYCHRAYAFSSRWRGCSYCLHYTIGGMEGNQEWGHQCFPRDDQTNGKDIFLTYCIFGRIGIIIEV